MCQLSKKRTVIKKSAGFKALFHLFDQNMSQEKENLDDEWLLNGALIAFTIIGLVAGAAFFHKTGSILLTIVGAGFGVYVGFHIGMLLGEMLQLFFGKKDKARQQSRSSSSSERNSSRNSNSHQRKEEATSANNLNPLDKFYVILECRPQDDAETIKRNYRRLIQEYHPDTLGTRASEKMLLIAKEKTQKVIEAYEIIKKYRPV
jgi:hypothetical protein